MTYMKCPDCMMPNHVSDDAITYRCFSCFGEIVFATCTECSYEQSIPRRWQVAFTCGRCEKMVSIPRRRTYSGSTKALAVQGYGYTYPKF
jgi:ribosomal protein S27E